MEGQKAVIAACKDLLEGIKGWGEAEEEKGLKEIRAGMEIDYALCRERYHPKPKDI